MFSGWKVMFHDGARWRCVNRCSSRKKAREFAHPLRDIASVVLVNMRTGVRD